jgi:anti-sigma B factor antagonist
LADLERGAQIAIAKLPREIDIANCHAVYAQLFAAIGPETLVVVADLTATTICDSSGIGEIEHARQDAIKAGVRFRFVVPPGGVLRVLQVLGLDRIWSPYPTLAAALDAEARRPRPGLQPRAISHRSRHVPSWPG